MPQYKGYGRNGQLEEGYNAATIAANAQRASVDYRDPATIAAMQANPNQPPAIMTYHTTSNSSL